ncbi:hypothetical protein HMPREF0973_02256 [Prevotella veroralis F0319]|uniref:Uncharacterized protein n=1 Tax=Prevotella veroralis F0319 TaxID=649761 RepID=C9MRJ8_9BACT|nr:hypothetical protein HMPREF0973_02256 [Prevotella veroralis F0319]
MLHWLFFCILKTYKFGCKVIYIVLKLQIFPLFFSLCFDLCNSSLSAKSREHVGQKKVGSITK